MMRNKSINHHTPQPPNVKSFNKPKIVCPRTKRSIPNPPKKREITKIVVGSFASRSHAIKKAGRSSLGSLFARTSDPARFNWDSEIRFESNFDIWFESEFKIKELKKFYYF